MKHDTKHSLAEQSEMYKWFSSKGGVVSCVPTIFMTVPTGSVGSAAHGCCGPEIRMEDSGARYIRQRRLLSVIISDHLPRKYSRYILFWSLGCWSLCPNCKRGTSKPKRRLHDYDVDRSNTIWKKVVLLVATKTVK